METIVASVRKTRRLLVVDNAWTLCGASAEIVPGVVERLSAQLGTLQFRRLGLAPVTCPTAPNLERLFYPSAQTIAAAVTELVGGDAWTPDWVEAPEIVEFKGPF